jgi:hypothetical protein
LNRRLDQNHRGVGNVGVIMGLVFTALGIIFLTLWTSQIWPFAGLLLPWVWAADAAFILGIGFKLYTTPRRVFILMFVTFAVGVFVLLLVSYSLFSVFRALPT